MTTQSKLTRLALTAAICGAVALPASSALAGDKTSRALFGALLGGVAGAALSHGDGGGVAIGALAGAAIGASTAKHHGYRGQAYRDDYRQDEYRQTDYGQTAYRQPSYGYDRYDRYDRYDHRGDYRPTSYDHDRGYGEGYGRYDTRYVYGR